MNATGHVQSKWRTKGVTLTLHRTRCIHASINLKKWNSSLIFTLCFYIIFVHCLWNFHLNLANKRRRKVIIRRVWLLRSTAVTMTWCQLNVTSANQQLHLSMTSLTRNACRSWVYEPRQSKIGSSKEIVGECKYLYLTWPFILPSYLWQPLLCSHWKWRPLHLSHWRSQGQNQVSWYTILLLFF